MRSRLNCTPATSARELGRYEAPRIEAAALGLEEQRREERARAQRDKRQAKPVAKRFLRSTFTHIWG